MLQSILMICMYKCELFTNSKVMQDCWLVVPGERPTFRIISEDAEKMMLDLGVADDYLNLDD